LRTQPRSSGRVGRGEAKGALSRNRSRPPAPEGANIQHHAHPLGTSCIWSLRVCPPPIYSSAPTLETLAWLMIQILALLRAARGRLCLQDFRAHTTGARFPRGQPGSMRSRFSPARGHLPDRVCTASARLPDALDESTSSTAAVYTSGERRAVVGGGGGGGRAAHRTLHALASVEEHRAGAHGGAGKDMAAQ
jgi:hypothetical protein